MVPHFVRALQIAAVVGTALCLINGSFAQRDLTRIFLNYLVPFLVSSYSSFAAHRRFQDRL